VLACSPARLVSAHATPRVSAQLQLLDSSEDISDVVQAYLPSQDIRSLVQEIRTRFDW